MIKEETREELMVIKRFDELNKRLQAKHFEKS